MKVLLSIKPEFVKEIINGTKKYEYRKKIFKQDVTTVIIYSTKPKGKLIGEFKIDKIIKNTPDKIWEETNNFAGVNKTFFSEYFYGRDIAYAIKIKEFKKYVDEIDPYKIYENFTPPQSYKYV